MVILFWRGYGFWVVLLPILAFLPMAICEFYNPFLLLWILFLGYSLIAYYGFKLNRQPIQKYKNVKTGEIFEVEEKHEFFFLPMQYWALAILFVGFLIAFLIIFVI
jgi:hypothetical protein